MTREEAKQLVADVRDKSAFDAHIDEIYDDFEMIVRKIVKNKRKKDDDMCYYEDYMESCEIMDIVPISKEGDWQSHHGEVIENQNKLEDRFCDSCGVEISSDFDDELCEDCQRIYDEEGIE